MEEKTEVVLSFQEAGSGGPYEEIDWSKGKTDNSANRIARLHPSTGVELLYWNEYCSGGTSPCDTSSKGELNIVTGDMTIYSVTISDEGFYYHDFYIDGGTPDTGHQYEIDLRVYGKHNN